MESKCFKWVYAKYIIRNGVRIYPRTTKVFRFKVFVDC